ncbi:MAG: 7-carboxy-7-deazaguanine synthase QueE [Gammaproteobacteria bacterium]|nr:7-carboxy-7-deazaguanine synthase QueE [Gammaproteobacteria bacterium]
MQKTLRITEIFHSIQGESRSVGIPTTFVRLTGCPLRCQYCDTEYAFSGGETRDLNTIMAEVKRCTASYVTVTGGEPLAQPSCTELLSMLSDAGYIVSLETSGAMDISTVDRRVSVVMDLKTPASGEVHRNLYSNIQHLKSDDQVKFVICDRQDYEWSKFKIGEYALQDRVSEILFSPSYNEVSARDLADWILADGLQVRLQLQIHKLLWGDVPGV